MPTVQILSPAHRLSTLVHAPGAAVAVDTVTVINGRVTVAYADVEAGADGQFVYAADEVLATKAAVTITEGDSAYWDPTAENFTNVDGAGANTLCGMWRAAAASGDAEGYLALDSLP